MYTKSKQVCGLMLLALSAATLDGCSQDGGHGAGPVGSAAADSFTSAVVSMAGNAPDDAAPVDIDAVGVVLVDDRPPTPVQ